MKVSDTDMLIISSLQDLRKTILNEYVEYKSKNPDDNVRGYLRSTALIDEKIDNINQKYKSKKVYTKRKSEEKEML